MKTILIVDDDLDTSLIPVLTAHGFRVFVAENGQDGLDLARTFKPDLVILDFMMPLMDSGIAGRALRLDSKLSSIKILMSTSLSQEAVNRYFDNYDGFLRKPYDIGSALEIVNGLLSHSTDLAHQGRSHGGGCAQERHELASAKPIDGATPALPDVRQ